MSQALAEKSPSNSSLLLEKLQEPPHIPGWKSRPRKKGFHWKTAWKKAGKRNFGAKNNPNKGNYPGGLTKKKPWIPPGGWGWGREWWERLWKGSFGNFGVAGSQRRPGRGTKSLLCLRRNPEKVVLQFPERLENRGKKKKKKAGAAFPASFSRIFFPPPQVTKGISAPGFWGWREGGPEVKVELVGPRKGRKKCWIIPKNSQNTWV